MFAQPGHAVGIALVAVLVAFAYRRSRAGRKLRSSREDPPAAQAIGVNIHRQRLLAFTISGALAGLAGGITSALGVGLACPSTEAWHACFSHGLVVIALVLLGWRFGRRVLSP